MAFYLARCHKSEQLHCDLLVLLGPAAHSMRLQTQFFKFKEV